jgi:hypothetical protein
MVLRKADRVRHLVRHVVDGDRNAEPGQQVDGPVAEFGDRLRRERKIAGVAATGPRDQAMIDEIEGDLDGLAPDRDRRRH